ncbi:16S rRNA processing protein RimM [Halarcobacter ebronensis]|uniref:Ribosome maturation factor RimM n=1 Tax=Halarcobacter ebronensis TaxID=1462615 RepID=A0A4Q0YGY3_9BACT|nr:ribosome maturation factor RimM [Halarcobacter ebronensis]RXJ69573.1 16S rRNA processing protein RimM [Halarcobacter ebronensis]
MNNKIYVGKLGKAVGLKGHLRLFIDSDFPEQFKKGAIFSTNKKLTLKVAEYIPSRDLIKFENYDNLEISKKLTNQELYVSQEDSKNNCNLEKNEYFWFDIIDCKIIEDKKELGYVKDIHRYPLDDYLEVVTETKLVDELKLPKTFLIPYKRDTYILSVDIDKKIIETKDCYAILENS